MRLSEKGEKKAELNMTVSYQQTVMHYALLPEVPLACKTLNLINSPTFWEIDLPYTEANEKLDIILVPLLIMQ